MRNLRGLEIVPKSRKAKKIQIGYEIPCGESSWAQVVMISRSTNFMTGKKTVTFKDALGRYLIFNLDDLVLSRSRKEIKKTRKKGE